jgi:hypothetical protein
MRLIAVAVLLLATAAPSAAGDVAAGRRKALACQACQRWHVIEERWTDVLKIARALSAAAAPVGKPRTYGGTSIHLPK